MTAEALQPYIGIPYLELGRDREALDCWGLVYHFYNDELGITLPLFDHQTAAHLARIAQGGADDLGWEKIDKPVDKCVIAMSQRGRALHHVAIFLEADGGTVLHSRPPASSLQRLKTLRTNGFHHFAFYRHHSHR